jgi:hypothetical protein
MEAERCPSVCGEEKCALLLGHKWKHRNKEGGYTWTTAGAERVNKELKNELPIIGESPFQGLKKGSEATIRDCGFEQEKS